MKRSAVLETSDENFEWHATGEEGQQHKVKDKKSDLKMNERRHFEKWIKWES